MTRTNVFAGVTFQRAPENRADDAWLTARRQDPDCRILPLWRNTHLVHDGRAARLAPDRLSGQETLVFLGLEAGHAVFLADFGDQAAPPAGTAEDWHDLRTLAATLPADDAGLLAYARGMAHWHRHHRFCGDCGHATASAEGGHVRICTGCGTRTWPRTDPAVIMLVHRNDQVLLAHARRHPEGQFSTLAGFVEPGESLEDAVRREVREEVGIEVDKVRYHSSQPWPFPRALMIAFTARATTRHIHIDGDEIQEAHWFNREALADLRLPKPHSVSWRLIDDWRRHKNA